MRHSKRSLEGELLIDHKAGPGVTEAFVRATGKESPAVPGGQVYESAVITCSHCQVTVVLNPNRTRDRTWCPKCDAYICDGCAFVMTQTLECRSAARRFDDLQEAAERGVTHQLLTRGV